MRRLPSRAAGDPRPRACRPGRVDHRLAAVAVAPATVAPVKPPKGRQGPAVRVAPRARQSRSTSARRRSLGPAAACWQAELRWARTLPAAVRASYVSATAGMPDLPLAFTRRLQTLVP